MNATIHKIKLSSLYGKYHKCVTCKEMFTPDGHKNCVTCRAAKALITLIWRHDHTARGLCVNCVKSSYYDKKNKHKQTRCDFHRKYHQKMCFNYYWKNRVKKPYFANKVRTHRIANG